MADKSEALRSSFNEVTEAVDAPAAMTEADSVEYQEDIFGAQTGQVLPLAAGLGNTAIDLPEYELRVAETRELRPDELRILERFRQGRRVIAEWFLRHPDVVVTAGDFDRVLKAAGYEVTKNAIAVGLHAIKKHPELGPHVYSEPRGRFHDYWCDYNAKRPADARDKGSSEHPSSPGMSFQAALGSSATRATIDESQAVPKLANEPGGIGSVAPLPPRWPGRHPSMQFELALRSRKTQETVLTDQGLSVHQLADEKHLFHGDRHINIPLIGITAIHLLALRPGGMPHDALARNLELLTNQSVDRRELARYMSLVEYKMRGTDSFEEVRMVDGNIVYRIPGAVPRDVSEWPAYLTRVRPTREIGAAVRLLTARE